MGIVLQEIVKSFGPKEVLRGFSLEVEEGETLFVIGFSGSGKSVALKHVNGLIRPDSGEVLVDGNRVDQMSQDALFELRRSVGYVFQFAALFDSMTIGENVSMGLRRIHGMSESEIRDRIRESLALVDLEEYEESFPSQLSGGQKKRAGIARAIATHPKYLLYDEPTTGLDPVTTTVINRVLVRMAEEVGVTGVVISHDMKSAIEVGDRIAMLYEGRVRWVGTPKDLETTDDPVVRSFVQGEPELLERGP